MIDDALRGVTIRIKHQSYPLCPKYQVLEPYRPNFWACRQRTPI